MKANPNMVAEIAGHTDTTGDETYNMWLSLWRAEAVVKFLTEQGIDPRRLNTTYFGEDQTYHHNDTFREGRSKQTSRIQSLKP